MLLDDIIQARLNFNQGDSSLSNMQQANIKNVHVRLEVHIRKTNETIH